MTTQRKIPISREVQAQSLLFPLLASRDGWEILSLIITMLSWNEGSLVCLCGLHVFVFP